MQQLATRLSANLLSETDSEFVGGMPRPDDLPLSFTQEGLWFLEQLESLGAAYSHGAAFQLLGALDVSALDRAVRELVCRHESLRTHFESVDGRGVQRIRDPSSFRLERLDASSLPDGAAERAEWIRLELARPFDLS
ncbi:MAG TPA: condensation domain-containing protein, partial [Nitrospiraceae bacterium]|nr:condensation domain-containing protein [Nitrospiraceae bacterium]